MGKILIIDDASFWRDVTADALRRNGYTTFTASNGLEALQSLQENAADLIILDMEMPRMAGLSFLQQVRKANAWKQIPVIMLTGDMQRDHVIEAKKLGVTDYLLKSAFSMPDLLTRVARDLGPATATHELPTLLTRDQSIARAEEALSSRNISLGVMEVITLAASPSSDLLELANVIGRDPYLSARVLQASNRAVYAHGHGKVTTLPDAVRLLGLTVVRDLAVSVGMFEAMPKGGDGFDPIRCWQHSLAVAKLCGRLAPAESSGTAYLVGLCHDLGEILFHTHFGHEYRQVLKARAATKKPIHEIERTMLGISHGTLVQTILKRLELPPAIARPIGEFHDSLASASLIREPLGRILHIADLFATGMLMATSGHATIRPLRRMECRDAVGVDDPSCSDAQELRAEIYRDTAHYLPQSSVDKAKLAEPLFPRRSVPVLVARESSLSPFDPVGTMLDSITQTTTLPRLPTHGELADYKGLVVLTRTDAINGFTSAEIAAAAKRSDGTPVPLLWLTGSLSEHSSADASHPVPKRWPIPLEAIARFVQSLGGKGE